MKNILVAIDFSPVTQLSINYAVSIARAFNAGIYLLNVYRDIIITGPDVQEMNINRAREEDEARLNRQIESIQEKDRIKVKGETRTGYNADTINEVAKEQHADLVIMGMKKEKAKDIFGNTILKMVRKSGFPLLVIPELAIYSPFKNIVLAVDFEELEEERTFEPLQKIITAFDAALRVVHVEKKAAELQLSEVSPKQQMGHVLSKFDYIYDKVEWNDTEEGIARYIDMHPCDLLVIVAHHHNIFERIFEKIHSRELVFGNKPLLVLRSGE